jgi:hypothetical protein
VVADTGFAERRLRNLLSPRLRLQFRRLAAPRGYPINMDNKWREVGLDGAYLLVYHPACSDEKDRRALLADLRRVQRGTPIVVTGGFDGMAFAARNKIPGRPLFIAAVGGPSHFEPDPSGPAARGIFRFPPFSADEEPIAARTADEVSQCYAVGIHIRRGDYVRGPQGQDRERFIDYRRAVEFVWQDRRFDSALLKRLFVFSDDIPWCREHAEQLGLDLGGQPTYVEGHKYHDAFRDLQLLSMCHVIIKGIGGFALTACAVSETAQCLVEATANKPQILWCQSDQV